MTPQTAKDLAELGMTPEQLAEKTREVEAKLHPNGDPATFDYVANSSHGRLNAFVPTPPARTRQPRSDKGTTRPPKAVQAPVEAPAQAGVLTVEQANMLSQLSDSMIDAAINAEGRRREYYRFLNSLTASK